MAIPFRVAAGNRPPSRPSRCRTRWERQPANHPTRSSGACGVQSAYAVVASATLEAMASVTQQRCRLRCLNNGPFGVVNLVALIAGSHLLAMEAQRAIAFRLMKVAMGKSSGEAGGALQYARHAATCHRHQGARSSPPPSTRPTTSSSSGSLNGLCMKVT